MTSQKLELQGGVEFCGAVYASTGIEPWLHLGDYDTRSLAGRFVEIVLRTSVWDEPCRPVIRFCVGGSALDAFASAPIAGVAIWLGRIPVGTEAISFSPTNKRGPFGFAVERIVCRSWLAVLWQGLRWRPGRARSAILTKLIGWGPESDVNLAWATRSMPLDAFDPWRRQRRRSFDFEGIDRLRIAALPALTIVVSGGDHAARLRQTLASLKRQTFPRWSALVIEGCRSSDIDPRARDVPHDELPNAVDGCTDSGLVCFLAAGDMLSPTALGYAAEQAVRHPEALLFYCDELQMSGDGRRIPVFKPDWSPKLESGRSYIGRGLFLRANAGLKAAEMASFLQSGRPPAAWLSRLTTQQVKSLRRFLVETPQRPLSPVTPIAPRHREAAVAIIIPTRDQPQRLQRAIDSIRAHSKGRGVQIVVVDNGSETAEAHTLLARLRSCPDVLVLDRPGPFNFSRMCNDGAAASTGAVLVFLNDDTEVLSAGWLDRLTAQALDETVGAVGAKLTYPDGRIQHIGVVVGMGGSAGHFGSLVPGDDPGWLGRNEVVHEVSAVTGACLAVSREKFDAVGGFDAEQLPIELSDIDLCLKLNARGWQTIVDPLVHLMHEESASRGGATFRRLDVYDGQRQVFIDRWRHVLRDDPFFHPGLSLYWWQPALG